MLRVEGLHVYYGAIHALKGVSLSVAPGELVTLLGANGAGKTTTLKSISGLLRPRAGTIELEGRALVGLGPHEIVKLGVVHVPEGRKIFPRFTVLENLKAGAYTRRASSIGGDLDLVFALFPRLKERARQIAGTLSGGEQQMLAIGRGLMAKPKLLLLDEPSMGLAPLLVRQIFDTIRAINLQGVTVLLVEQNAAMALDISERGYVLETGNVILEGKAGDLGSSDQVRQAYLGG
ncbi:MAG: ABC transporter ATP-binding protein [Deltaproteobacteria bacterium GWA2_57_13]|nr:MAG: ABC transporter ATP-binding protein [Deltaproteobacteria bacterium GWA2_57_13]OGQ80361.1 MAG: ABC transporter ATP-binding protein [Deltaproteobacteria bacterium RIFCSPLOWO2_12_FULL_57_22]